MVQRTYVDTSIVGGYFDEEFKDATLPLFQRLLNKEVKFVVSDLLDLELMRAPKRVAELLNNFPSECFDRIELTSEAIDLADAYIREGKR